MRAGALDRRVVLWRSRAEKNSLNEDVLAWYPLTPAGVACSLRAVSDAERVQAQAVGAVIEARFVVRWSRRLADLTPKDLAACEGKVWDIVGVKETGRREGLEISARACADPPELVAS